MDAKPRLAVFCSGNGSNFEAIAAAVKKNKLRARIACLVCDKPGARAVERAHRYQVPVVLVNPKLFSSRKDYEKFIVRVLRNQGVEVVILAGFMRILTPHFIRAYQGKILNIHPSYLPQFKGAHAIRDAYEAGVRETGVTVHLVTEDVDTGPILAQERVKIRPSDTLASLEKRIHAVEHRLYPAAIAAFLKSTSFKKIK